MEHCNKDTGGCRVVHGVVPRNVDYYMIPVLRLPVRRELAGSVRGRTGSERDQTLSCSVRDLFESCRRRPSPKPTGLGMVSLYLTLAHRCTDLSLGSERAAADATRTAPAGMSCAERLAGGVEKTRR